MRTYLLLLSLLIFGIGEAFSQELNNFFQLIPQPQSIKKITGKGIALNELTYIQIEQEEALPLLGEYLNKLPRCPQQGKPIRLRLTQELVPSSSEGYILEINDKGVTISARKKEGLFYACQTLEQLIEDCSDFSCPLPFLEITDYPAIAYRAVHFDTKHHLNRMEHYYREIDMLARYKINAVIWEIEDKLRYTRRPEIAAPNAISKQEMQALCRYAKERNIEISPLVQGLGHASFILKHHWELRENPLSDWEFCPSHPQTYEIQFDLYQDALEAMPYGKYLHVGGDEITAIGIDERCKATGKSAFELQMIWLQKVCAFAIEHGRTPIFWDDMPLKYGGIWNLIQSNATDKELENSWNTQKLDDAIKLFPKECVYMRWNYQDATQPAHQRILKWYRDKGLKVMGATAAAAGDSPFLPRQNSRSEYIKGFSQLVANNGLEGILATAWDDGSPHAEVVKRGYIAQGEFGWNPSARNIEAFKVAHAQREYGFKPKDHRMNFLDELEKAIYFFDDALVTSGRRQPAWGTTEFTLIDLPNKEKPGNWSRTYEEKIKRAEIEEKRYLFINKSIQTAKQEARRNRYTLDAYEQINQLQHYPTQLLLALNIYDMASGEIARKKALNQIDYVCNSFEMMRKELEEVFSKTLFMQNPEGYLSDLNHHNHLAAKTNNSDWLYLYEIPMIYKTKKWIIN